MFHRTDVPRSVYPSGDGCWLFLLSALTSDAAVNIPVRFLCGRTFSFPLGVELLGHMVNSSPVRGLGGRFLRRLHPFVIPTRGA